MVKRHGHLYEKVYDIENLRLAHINARKGKTHYKDVKMVDKDPEFYLKRVQQSLINQTFNTSPYEVFTKVDKGKEREIYKLPYYPDRIVQWAVMQIVEPIWLNQFIRNTHSSIPIRGIHDGLRKLDKMMKDKEGTKYCLKIDIEKFYPSINHRILKVIVRRKIKDRKLLWLLDNIIDSIEGGVGVPIGNYLSQYFGNLFLTPFDKWLLNYKGVTYYSRYCDDCVILHHDKEFLHMLLLEMQDFLESKLRLRLKHNYQIFPTYIRGIDYLGYRSFGEYRLLRKSTAKRYKRLCRNVKKQGFVTMKDKNRLASYNGWLIPANTHNLRNKYEKELNMDVHLFGDLEPNKRHDGTRGHRKQYADRGAKHAA